MPWRPLGEVFVERGLITQEELEDALREQQGSGKRLGEILIAHGLVPGPAVTAALTEQLGIELQTEAGFGTGPWKAIDRRHRRRRGLGEDDAPRAGGDPDDTPQARDAEDSGEGRSEPGADRQPEEPEPRGQEGDLPERDEEVERLLAEIEGQDAEIAELRARLEELGARLAQAAVELAEKRGRRGAAEAEAAGARRVEPGTPARFLLFVPSGGRYELVEREGPVPGVGAELEVGEPTPTLYFVSKLGASPLPHDERPCAYLQPLR